jgi:hypothetical protein
MGETNCGYERDMLLYSDPDAGAKKIYFLKKSAWFPGVKMSL